MTLSRGETIRLRLKGKEDEIPALLARYAEDIRERRWPIEKLAKTEMLQESPDSYAGKVGRSGRARSAAYELALKSGRGFRAGDQVSYYVTGERKSVSVHENARLVSDFDSSHRDENVAYYLAKLDALAGKFAGSEADEGAGQGQLDLGL